MLLAEQRRHPSRSMTSQGADSEEEKRWTQYRRSRGANLSSLMEFYLPLVTQVVNRLSARFYHKVEPTELLGVAILGLYEAIQRYSDDREVPFSAYARKRIAGAVLDEMRRRDPLTREQRTQLRSVKAALDRYAAEHGRAPNEAELAEQLDMPVARVERILSWDYHTVSLHDEVAEGLTYQDAIPDANALSPMEHADRESAREALRRAIPKLDVRDQQLLFFRHTEALSITEIAAVFGVTPGRVSQMYQSTIVRLRSLMKVTES